MNSSFDKFCLDPIFQKQNSENNPFISNLDYQSDVFDCLSKQDNLFPNFYSLENIQLAQITQNNISKLSNQNHFHLNFSFENISANEHQQLGQSTKDLKQGSNQEDHQLIPEENSPIHQSASKKKSNLERGRYNILNQELKRKIVEETREHTVVQVAKKYGVSVNNICRWRKRCDRRSGAGRKITDVKMEKALLKWIQENPKQLTRKIIQKKAKQYSENIEFKASKGWFQRFFKRNQLTNQFEYLAIKQGKKYRNKDNRQNLKNQIIKKQEESISNQ